MPKTVYESEHYFVVAVSGGDLNIVPKVGTHAILIRCKPEGTYITTPAHMEVVPFGHNPAILIPTVETD